jgi:hypothetical protein
VRSSARVATTARLASRFEGRATTDFRETLASRTYKVKRSEFPLSVTIAPKNTTGNAATTVVIGHIREMKNGEEIDEHDAKADDVEGILT